MNTNFLRERIGNPSSGRDALVSLFLFVPLRVSSWLISGLLVLSVLAACGNAEKKPVELKTVEDRFPIKVSGQVVQMQVAITLAESQKGLMFRQTLGADEGMIFLHDQPQQMSFWMRNVDLPLDIGFFDATGELKEIYPMYPHDERPVTSRDRHLQFALEMNQGWYRRNALKPGAKLDLAALAEAVKARGFKPGRFGLE